VHTPSTRVRHADRERLANPPVGLTLREASQLQARFRRIVERRSCLPKRVRLVAGLDSAYRGNQAFGAAVTVNLETMKPEETAAVQRETDFPYVPGFLAFREAPIIIGAAMKLKNQPDVYFVDGHGWAHPRRFGLACHVGVALNAPTIGVAKSRLCGTVSGNRLRDRGETIGAVLRSGSGKLLYVSVGHKVSLRDAVNIAKRCFSTGSRDPISLAHIEANRLRDAITP
jgi:deoxyribonuclease V